MSFETTSDRPQVNAGLTMEEGTLWDRSSPGRCATDLPMNDAETARVRGLIPVGLRRAKAAELPECSELDVIRHFTRLSSWNYSIDGGFYPLGSCTMKYNPRVNEAVSLMDGFRRAHPMQPESTIQGCLEVMATLTTWLKDLTGMAAVTLQPAAGAHGEWAGLKMMAAYLKDKGQAHKKVILIPDSAHGTNPASAAMAGFIPKTVAAGPAGVLRLEDVLPLITDDVAAMMVTIPNTLGLFEKDVHRIAEALHAKGAFLYMDGANMNALLGTIRPGDFGADILQFNLHKTFSTPHGGGGPGSGPVAVCAALEPYLPTPFAVEKNGRYELCNDRPKSIGPVKSFYGQFGMFMRAYAYILAYGRGIGQVSKDAVLNANYLLALLKDEYEYIFEDFCMHEFVLTDKAFKSTGVSTLDIAKALIDEGYHPPTIYFPLVVSGALMIEPTETETKEEIEKFARTMKHLLKTARKDPEALKNGPKRTFVGKVDEALAARKLCLCDPNDPTE